MTFVLETLLPAAPAAVPAHSQRWLHLAVSRIAWLGALILWQWAALALSGTGSAWAADAAGRDPVAGSAPVSFQRDVMAVLSKAGCNMGACHGNLNGKGGFKLSLRGENPVADYEALVRGEGQRRIDLLDPDESLILQKASGRVVHQGGLRFRRDSLLYRILRDWIAAGAAGPRDDEPPLVRLEVTPQEAIVVEPQDHVPLAVIAVFADGTRRDVTALACFEPTTRSVQVSSEGVVVRSELGQATVLVRYLTQQVPVRLAFLPQRPGFRFQAPPPVNYIDELVFAQLARLQIIPAPVCDDTTFLRRAYLDAIGLPPTAEQARQFLADPSPDKRARLIDDLLARPEFAEHWALKWSDVLRNEEKVLDARGVDAFFDWICASIAGDKPLDQFTRELVTGLGSTYANPAANYYRANRDPLTRGETTARLFLGVRLQCARCHNHPYDRWTQDDYYGWVAIFSRIDYQILSNQRRDRLDKHEFNGEQVVFVRDEGDLTNPRTGLPAEPQFLGGQTLPIHPHEDRLQPLADWMASPHNAMFVKTQANFIWYHVMRRGLVEPIDDFRPTNPPSNPALLDALAADLVAGGMRLKPLVRTIMNSRTYQLSSEPNETNIDDEGNFSRAVVRRLPAETLLDAQCTVLGVWPKFAGYPEGTRAGQVRGVERVRRRDGGLTAADRFLRTFGKPERLLACECERSNETTLKQALTLLGDEGLDALLRSEDNRLAHLVRSGRPAAEILDELYWAALSRPPTAEEQTAGLALLATSDESERLAGLQDLAWALLNSKEFIFRH